MSSTLHLDEDNNLDQINEKPLKSILKKPSFKNDTNTSQDKGKCLKRRLLFSLKKENITEITMSSQEEHTPDNSPPYKIQFDIGPKLSEKHADISFSYIKSAQNEKAALLCNNSEEEKEREFSLTRIKDQDPKVNVNQANISFSYIKSVQNEKAAMVCGNNEKKERNSSLTWIKNLKNGHECPVEEKSIDPFSFESPIKSSTNHLDRCFARTYIKPRPSKFKRDITEVNLNCSGSDLEDISTSFSKHSILKENLQKEKTALVCNSNTNDKNKECSSKWVEDKYLLSGYESPVEDSLTDPVLFESPIKSTKNQLEACCKTYTCTVSETKKIKRRKTKATSNFLVNESKNISSSISSTYTTLNLECNTKETSREGSVQNKHSEILQELAKDLTQFMDVVNYTPSVSDWKAIGSIIPCQPSYRGSTSIQFGINEVLEFGKILLENVSKKAQKVRCLECKERQLRICRWKWFEE